MTATERDARTFRELIWSLHCDDIRVGVVAAGRRGQVERLVRELIGDGVVEVLITGDDVMRPKPDPETYQRALHELGVSPANAMAFEHSATGFRTARAARLATVVITTELQRNQEFAGAAAVLDRYDSAEPLSAQSCRRLHERWWISGRRLSA